MSRSGPQDMSGAIARPSSQWLTAGVAGFCLVLIGAMWLTAESLIFQERANRSDEAILQNTNLVRAFEEHTARTLDYVDEIAGQLVRRLERGDWPRSPEELTRGLNSKIIRGLGIVGPNGASIISQPAPPQGFSIADRRHFTVHVEDPRHGFYLSEPLEARPIGTWAIIASRRFNKPDGDFGGVVVIAVDPYYFSDFYRQLDFGRNSIVALTGTDGIVRARLPDYAGSLGVDVKGTELFNNILKGAPTSAFEGTSRSDGIRRLWVSHFVRDYPLIVSIGVTVAEVYAATHRRAGIYRIFAAAGSALVIAFFVGYLFHLAGSKAAEDQRRADAMLRESFINASTVIAWMKDENGRYVFMSGNYQRYFGIDPAHGLGKTDDDIWPTGLSLSMHETDRQILAGKDTGDYVDKHPLPGGRESWWLKHKFAYVDAAGRRFVGGVGVDVTERVQAEEKLKSNEALLETIINSSPDWIFAKDLNRRYLLANTAFAGAQNRSPEDLVGRSDTETWWQAPGEEDQSATIAETHKADDIVFAGAAVRRPRQERPLSDGRSVWTDTIKVPLRDATGGIFGLVGFSRDVTDIVKADASVRLFTTIVEQIPISVMVTTTDGTIEYVNPAFTEATGFSFDEAVGQNPRRLNSGQTDPEIYRELWDTIKRGDTWRGEVLNRTKSGTTIWERVVVAPLKDETGRTIRFVAIRENITRAKAAQADLIEAKERAEQANRAKSTFLAMMSHELRTPLNAIIGFSEMLRYQKLGPLGRERYVEYAADIESSGRHLLEVLNDVLDLAKLETGRFKAEIRDYGLGQIVTALSGVLTSLAADAGHKIAFVVDNPSVVSCDQRAVRQILLNLVSNAAKYTKPGGRIEVGLRKGRGHSVELYVADNGIGMAKADIERSTELFTRLSHDLDRLPDGVGIGLYMVKRLVETMGATLLIESEPGVGTEVVVAFPCKAEALAPDHATA